MKHISDLSDSISTDEMKACVDICLINKFSRITNAVDNTIRYMDNVYRFIYGDTNDVNAETITLNFRYRNVSEYGNLRANHGNCDCMTAVLCDIKDAYNDYVKNRGIPTYGGIKITEIVIDNAITDLRKELINTVFKLYTNETIYTLFLDTPIGRNGIQSQTNRRANLVHQDNTH